MNQNYNNLTTPMQPRNNLPAVAGQLTTPESLMPFLVGDEEAKIKLQMNWLCLQARDNPELEAGDFINFIRTAQKTGADPERKQIHLVTFKKKIKVYDHAQNRQVEKWVTKGEPIFSYHYFVARAEQTGELKLMEVETEPCDYRNPATGEEIKNTICAKATVIRQKNGGHEQKRVYRAYFPEFVKLKDEYSNGQRTGNRYPTEAWASKPYLMLEKCALANALRLAFEAELSGMYIPEEMHGNMSAAPSDEPKDVSPKPVQAEVVDQTQNVDPQPQPENESQAQPAEEQPFDPMAEQPGDEFPTEEPAQQEAPKEVKAEVVPKPSSAPMASKRSKHELWSRLKFAADEKKINLDQALKKIESVSLTEELCQQLIATVRNNGDLSWFNA